MPVKRTYASIPVQFAAGGRLLPDLPKGTVGAADFDEKLNFVSEIGGEVRKRAGWDYPVPYTPTSLRTFGSVGSAQYKWSYGVQAANGWIYCVPHAAATILKINPETGDTEEIGSLGAGTFKYAGAVLADNGCIYGIPFSATAVLKIDPTTDTITTFGSLSGDPFKWEGGVKAGNGMIYGMPSSLTTVLKIDPTTDTVSTFGSVAHSGSGWGQGALASNGKIYAAPVDGGAVLKIDPDADTASTFGSLAGSDLWGMTVAAGDFLYGIPYNSTGVLKIDPDAETAATFGSLTSGGGKWYGGALAANGMIYATPIGATTVLVIDPASETMEEIGSLSGTAKWSHAVLADNGKIYGVPYWSATILEITPSVGADTLSNFDSDGPLEAIAGVRRPNGTYAVVGAGVGKLKFFDYDQDEWIEIGSGYSTAYDEGFRWWQILDIAGYAVFNNGRDLPCTWQIGDEEVRPLYEFREAGYASAGGMVEYVDGVLLFFDILEINDADMSDVMNDPLPYQTIVDSAITTRIGFRRVWSNIGDPRDFAPTVPGSISSGTSDLTLAWPMASFAEGDEIVINGAGAAGGNLTTTISAITGTAVTLADNASTTVANADVYKAAVSDDGGIDGIVGYDDIEDDGSALVMCIPLKTQLINFKASGNLWQTYYTGDVGNPFTKDRVGKKPSAAPIFPRAIVSVNDDYLLYPGAKHFYKFNLGSQAAEEDVRFAGAERSLFFDRVRGLGTYDVWAADNGCTDEILFAYLWQDYEIGYYGANRALAFKYASNCEPLSEIDSFNFTCAATVQKPLAGTTCDETEKWFLMGDGDGAVTLYGETNLEVLSRERYGEAFEASLGGGLFTRGPGDTGVYARRFSLNPSNPDASRSTEVTIYGADMPNDDPAALETKTLTNPRFPGSMGLYYRKPYYKYRLVSDTNEEMRLSGVIWRFGSTETQAVERLSGG